MLGFFRFGSMVGALAGGLALVGAFGGCGPATGTCSADHHTVLGTTQQVIATCTTAEACSNGGASADAGTSAAANAGCAICDPTLCLPKNQCILGWQNYDDYVKTNTANETTECRLTCNAQSDCPFNYHCVPSGTAGTNYCINDRTAYKPAMVGEAAAGAPWGVACSGQNAGSGNGPLIANPSCDTSQQFWCYATSPTDANGYCTQEQCNDDGDCPGGWWCATVNDAPDVRGTGRTDYGPPGMSAGLTTVCMPRGYNLKPGTFCAPCTTDLDCPPNQGIPQHCLSADNASSTEKTCAVECAPGPTSNPDANCPDDDACVSNANVTNNVCLPRAGTCTGNQTFCSPCHSDKDCDPINGYCVVASGTDFGVGGTEHFCTTKSGVACSVSGNTLTDMCPSTTGTPTSAGVSCSYNAIDFNFPLSQCFGLVNYATGTDATQIPGCWSKHCPSASCP